jgi:hypothetical protein
LAFYALNPNIDPAGKSPDLSGNGTTSTFDSTGGISVTNAINSNVPHQFYLIKPQ